tara:strand:- start:20101 stop:20496 length:396 start_codon:yes stop_codon:yes gene_type:complete
MRGVETANTLMIIDVMPVIESKKIHGAEAVVNHIKSNISNIQTLLVHVSKKLTITTVERESSFIRKLAHMFYAIEEPLISTVTLFNVPKVFSTIFGALKPLLTKDAAKMITIVQGEKIPSLEHNPIQQKVY